MFSARCTIKVCLSATHWFFWHNSVCHKQRWTIVWLNLTGTTEQRIYYDERKCTSKCTGCRTVHRLIGSCLMLLIASDASTYALSGNNSSFLSAKYLQRQKSVFPRINGQQKWLKILTANDRLENKLFFELYKGKELRSAVNKQAATMWTVLNW